MSRCLNSTVLVALVLASASIAQAQAVPSFPSASNLSPVVSASAIHRTADSFQYEYVVQNASSSVQDVSVVGIRCDLGKDVQTEAPAGWSAGFSQCKGDWVTFTALENRTRPGQTQRGLYLYAEGITGLVDVYVHGWVPVEALPVFPLGEAPEDLPGASIVKNSVHLQTIGPVPIPQKSTPIELIRMIVGYRDAAVRRGWITNTGVLNSLDAKLRAAQAALERGQNREAINILGALLNEVDAQAGKQLSPEAVALLKFNTQFLIGKIQ